MFKLTFATVLITALAGGITGEQSQSSGAVSPKNSVVKAPPHLTVEPIDSVNSATGMPEAGVALTVQNLTDIEILFPDVHIYVDQNSGEAKIALLQREST